jgi:ABC-type Fe3+ transport system substrate-binding protein
MRTIARRTAATFVCCLGLLAAAAGASRSESLDEIYAQAKAEGAFAFYVGGPTAPWEASARIFEQRYPGIKVSITGGFSNVLDRQIDQQIRDDRLLADTAIFQTLHDFVRWKKEGELLAFKPEGFDAIDASFKDKEGAFYGVMVIAMPYQYNTQLVSAADVPKSALDFLKPQFRGKVVAAYPADDDATLYLFDTIVQKYGWDYMQRLMYNKPRFIRGHLGVTQEIARGRAALSFDVSASSVAAGTGSGAIKVTFPAEDPIPIFETRAGIFKGAPHPHAARLFEAWLLSRDYQSRQGAWSTRGDVAPTGGFKPITDYNTASQFRDFMLDEALVADLRKRFESYMGPVSGDPVLGGGGSNR